MMAADAMPDQAPALICHINLERGFRGGERQTELLIRALAALGWKQILVAGRGAALAERLHQLPGLEIRSCTGLLSAAIQIDKPDLVHVHQGRAIYPAYLRRLVSTVPYLVTRRVPSRPDMGPLARRAYRRASKVVAISQAVAQTLAEATGLPTGQMAIVPSAFESTPPNPDAVKALRALWGGEFVVGNVGALDHGHKGQGDLIAVARAFAASHPLIRFVFVGSGKDEVQFRRQAQGLGNLHFAGFQERVGDYLAAFDLFAFPSLKEGLGSVLLDAMDHGLAVVASDVGGIPEVVVDGETGVLVPPGSPADLGQAIARLYHDPALRQAMGVAGRKYSQRFTAAIMADRYIGIYRSILA